MRWRCLTSLVGCLALFATLATGPGVAQDVDVFDPQTNSAGPGGKSGGTPARPKTVPKGPVCYAISASVDKTKPNGLLWDGPGDTDPDIEITEQASGAKSFCRSTFSCTLTVTLGTSSAKLTLFDKDLKYHDEIGSGTCSSGKTCRLGSASVSMKRC